MSVPSCCTAEIEARTGGAPEEQATPSAAMAMAMVS
jgi:hypothetical protein